MKTIVGTADMAEVLTAITNRSLVADMRRFVYGLLNA